MWTLELIILSVYVNTQELIILSVYVNTQANHFKCICEHSS